MCNYPNHFPFPLNLYFASLFYLSFILFVFKGGLFGFFVAGWFFLGGVGFFGLLLFLLF